MARHLGERHAAQDSPGRSVIPPESATWLRSVHAQPETSITSPGNAGCRIAADG